MTLVGLALRNLWRRPMRSTLSILGVALAVGSAVALLALARSVEMSGPEGLDERGSDLTVTQRGATDIFGGFLREDLEPKLAAVPGVTGVAGELAMFVASERNRNVLTVGWTQASFFWQRIPIREGRLPSPGEGKVAVLGNVVAEALGKRVGDDIALLGETFRVIAIANYASMVNRGLVIVPLADLQELTFRSRQVTLFHLQLARSLRQSEVERIMRDVAGRGPVLVSKTSETLRDDRNIALLNAITLAISAIALTMGMLNILNTLLMTVQERTREIGIVAAIGWPDSRIVAAIVIEGLMLSLPGCAIGVLLAYGASFVFQAIPVIGTYLTVTLTVGLVLPAVAATVALCSLGSLYPAWRATRMTPAEALQRA